MSRLRLELVAAIAIFLLAWTQSSRLEPKQESGILPIDPPTPYIHYIPGAAPRGRVLAVHGLDVSKEVLQLISAALTDGGFEVYSIDLPGHGDSKAKFQTELAQQAIRNAKANLGEKTIVLGHSLGAGLLLDLAATEHFSTIVLLSPPPVSIAEIHANRVLIATGDIDIPRIRKFVPIAADIGGPNVESWMLPWAAHSAPIFNPVHVRRVVEWLGGDGGKTRTVARMSWIVVMFIASVGFGVLLMPGTKIEPAGISIPALLVWFVAAGSVSLVILRLANPFAWLHLFATDYLIGFLFITGLILCVATWAKGISHKKAQNPQALLRILCLFAANSFAPAAFVIIVPGLLVTSHTLYMTLSDGRWWRFPCIALAGLPLFIYDEWTIRRIHPRWKSIGVALITRGLLWAFLFTGVLVFNRANAFLVLIVPLIAIFWIALWFATGVVHRHTQDPLAAALFAALVQGWAFAAWFVTI